VKTNFSSNVQITAAAPAVKARRFLAGRVAIEFGELAVVPMTWRRERPASFLTVFDLTDDFTVCEVGVNRTPQGPTLNRGFVGVAIGAMERASLFVNQVGRTRDE
jgi:hypothetical protein